MRGSAELGRRGLGRWAAAAAGLSVVREAAAQSEPKPAGQDRPAGQSRKETLILGLDIADTTTFDPARQTSYSAPLTLAACYDTLVTLNPGHYEDVVEGLATAWERTSDGRGWRFTLRPDAAFASGNRVTPEDCAFSLTRLLAVGDPPAHYLDNITAVFASGPNTVDIMLDDPARPLLPYLASITYAILERAALEAQDTPRGVRPNVSSADTASEWLGQHSAGSGDYALSSWRRREHIELEASPNAWRGPPAYRRILIRHLPDSTSQLRAVQRGDIDAAFNLIPQHIEQLQTDPTIRIQSTRSLDMAYLALNGDAGRSEALAIREARQAIGYAIDYDDLLGRLLGGTSVRPASFLPVGLRGSEEATVREIGLRQDLDLARRLLTQAGLVNGFGFELSYSDTAIAGLSFEALARKLRTDLARVGITVRLAPMNAYAWRDAYVGGKTEASLGFWTSPVVDNGFWARACLDRLAGRVGFVPPPALRDVVTRAEAEADPAAQRLLWLDYQKALINQANFVVLFQPTYQVAVRKQVAWFPLTAAGWMADLDAARPADGSR